MAAPVLDASTLQRCRQQLQAHLAHLRAADRHGTERELVIEALLWIDAGTYGRCSVCSTPLDHRHLLTRPARKACSRCFEAGAHAHGRLEMPSASPRMADNG